MKHSGVWLAILILLNLPFQQALWAHRVPDHVLPLGELKIQFEAHTAQRFENTQEIRKLIYHRLVQKELGELLALERVELALATLDDETVDELASQPRSHR